MYSSRFARCVLASALALLLTQGGTSFAQASPRLTLQDILASEGLGETALSPDGNTFAFARGGQIVLMPSAGGWPITLTSLSLIHI